MSVRLISRCLVPVLLLLLACSPAFGLIAGKYRPVCGAEQLERYLPMLQDKRVALIINQTSVVDKTLLLDTLLSRKVKVVKVFVPEHGFRGTADAGAHIANEKDKATGLPVISLYGNNKKPTREQLADVDILIYDLQDVGVRFYTYISTLQYAMEACAAYGKTLLLLDRPNPNGHYVDGPVLDTSLKSFVGMQSIPVVYGMTAGEYAQMLRGEQWFAGARNLQIRVITCVGYERGKRYELPVAPSPNLKTMAAVYLYPSLCLFEGTVVSLGRGTDKPFQQWGHPDFRSFNDYYFVPEDRPGAHNPVLKGQKCFGQLVAENADDAFHAVDSQLNIRYLLKAYELAADKGRFFTPFFEKLAGTKTLREQIIAGKTEEEIRESWQPKLKRFKAIRRRYLMYGE